MTKMISKKSIWSVVDKEKELWKCRRCYNRQYDKEQYKINVLEKPKVEGKKRTREGHVKIRVPNHARADHRG